MAVSSKYVFLSFPSLEKFVFKILEMDASTARGMSAAVCAKRILETLLNEEKDVLICDLQSRVGFWLRFVCPSLYYWVMEKRAFKLDKEN